MVWPNNALSIVLATTLGAIIWVESEFSGKAAGLQVNLLVSLGASIFIGVHFTVWATAEVSGGNVERLTQVHMKMQTLLT